MATHEMGSLTVGMLRAFLSQAPRNLPVVVVNTDTDDDVISTVAGVLQADDRVELLIQSHNRATSKLGFAVMTCQDD